MKKIITLFAMILVAMNLVAQTTEITSSITFDEWSEGELHVYNDDAMAWSVSGNTLTSPRLYKDQTSTITIVAKPTVKSTLEIGFNSPDGTDQNLQDLVTMEVYVDDVLLKSITHNVLNKRGPYYFFDLTPGEHTLRLVARQQRTDSDYNTAKIFMCGMQKTDHVVQAEVTEPGSLGQEVLYDPQVSVLSDVHCLKVTGTLNDADWTTLKNMGPTLWKLDLSGVTNTAIPNDQFYNNGNWNKLHEVVLPAGLTQIGNNAFYGTRITGINFPSTVDVIGNEAFRNSYLEAVALPESYCTTGWGNVEGRTSDGTFIDCQALKTFSLAAPEKVKVIGTSYLRGCVSLTGFVLPQSVTEVGEYGLCDCWNNDFGTMSSVKKFTGWQSVMRTGVTHLEIMNAEAMGLGCFSENRNLQSVAIGPNFWKWEYGTRSAFTNCPQLTTVRLYSPNVCVYYQTFTAASRSGMTLQVPNYLVNNYKTDAEWMTFGTIEGFSTEDVERFTLHQNLTLGARQRMEGSPNLNIPTNILFKIGGETAQNFNEVQINHNLTNKSAAQVVSTCPNVSVNRARMCLYTSANQWKAVALPFDVTVDEITSESGNYAVRYYDGVARAANGIVSGNKSWKDYQPGEVIPAGTGFILMTSAATWTHFLSEGNGNALFATQATQTPLNDNPSATPANKGWNLVGNPYQCYYDAKEMNFNAPITCFGLNTWGDITSYKAYSLVDDDYILLPNEAFFVQAPEGIDHITFAIDGKQTDSTVRSRSNTKAQMSRDVSRYLTDLTLSDGENTDRTRVVMNEEASEDYELTCDAGKMFGEGLQLYTIGYDGLQYAINERPLTTGLVDLGLKIPADGTYTFSLTRNNAEHVALVDLETGSETDMLTNDYTFTAQKGTLTGRFFLKIATPETTVITGVNQKAQSAPAVYDLAGHRVATGAQGLKPGIYVVGGRKIYVK